MNKSKLLRAAAGILIVAGLFIFPACSQQTASAAQTASETDKAQGRQTQSGQTAIYGKVTAVDGAKITLALGTLKREERQGGASGGGRPAGSEQAASGSAPQGSRPEGGRGDSSGSRSERQGMGQFADLLTMTGENKTIEITDTGILTRQSFGGFGGGNRQTASDRQAGSAAASSGATQNASGRGMTQGTAASLSDIKAGALLRVTYDASGKMTAVQILGAAEENASSSQSN